MNHGTDKEWLEYVVESYDKHVAANAADGATMQASRDAFVENYIVQIDSGIPRYQTDVSTEGRTLFDHGVGPIRKGRRSSLTRVGRHLLDALNGDTILGVNDPVLDQAFPLGTSDGRDKTLRNWTQLDWVNARTERYRNAADATAAAREFDVEVADRFIAALERPNVRRTGDLFGVDPDDDDETSLADAS